VGAIHILRVKVVFIWYRILFTSRYRSLLLQFSAANAKFCSWSQNWSSCVHLRNS